MLKNRKGSLPIIAVVVIVILALAFSNSASKPKATELKQPETTKAAVSDPLESMLRPIMESTSINGQCLEYTLYYHEYLKKNYPELDVRRIEMAGVCTIGTKECGDYEGIPHTYLIVNGHGGECILDQKKLACIQLRNG